MTNKQNVLHFLVTTSIFIGFTSSSTIAAVESIQIEMVTIKGGCFNMGSPKSRLYRERDEQQHEVCVKDFEIAKHEVTQAQWKTVMGNNPSRFKGDKLPVEMVSWNNVQKFIQALNTMLSANYRLPTEAEWEYAIRAKTQTAYYWGDDVDCSKANYSERCNIKKPTDIGSYPPNAYGLYDMSGNVWEWTCSEYDQNYGGTEQKCISNSNSIVLRGGSWSEDSELLRSASRFRLDATVSLDDIGFRLSRTL